jgi:hypothetical protein
MACGRRLLARAPQQRRTASHCSRHARTRAMPALCTCARRCALLRRPTLGKVPRVARALWQAPAAPSQRRSSAPEAICAPSGARSPGSPQRGRCPSRAPRGAALTLGAGKCAERAPVQPQMLHTRVRRGHGPRVTGLRSPRNSARPAPTRVVDQARTTHSRANPGARDSAGGPVPPRNQQRGSTMHDVPWRL